MKTSDINVIAEESPLGNVLCIVKSSIRLKASKMNIQLTIASLTVGAMLLPSSTVTIAQESTYVLEEIVVSARRRDENANDVPVSLSVFNDKTLKNAAIDNVVGISELTPGLHIEPGVDDNTARYFIRGVGTATPDVGNEPAVPVYIDDIYVPSGLGSNFDLFALDRIEVLRGPQGTLYGRNSFGGAVKFYSRNIEVDSAEGSVSYAVGTAEQRNFKTEIRAPLIEDKLWFGGGFAHLENAGYQNLIHTGTKGWAENSDIYKLKLSFHPSDSIRLGITYDRTYKNAPAKFGKIRNIGTVGEDGVRTGDFFTGPIIENFPGAVPNMQQQSTDPDDIETDLTSNSVLELEGLSWRAEVDFSENLSVKYIGASRDIYNRRIFDIDGTAAPFLAIVEDYDLSADSHELQLSWDSDRLQVIGGVYFYQEDTASLTLEAPNNFLIFFDQLTIDAANLLTDIQGRQTATDASRLFTRVRQDVESTAVFVNGTYALTDKLKISAGLRYTKDKKVADTPIDGIGFVGGTLPRTLNVAPPGRLTMDIIDRFNGVITNPIVTASGEGAQDYSEITPTVTIDYTFHNDNLLYGSYRRGFLSGVLYPIAGSIQGAEVATNKQGVDAFEIGYKASYDRFRHNISAYYYKFDGLAVSVNTPVPASVSGTGFAAVPTNADAASSKGVEFDFNWLPTDNFIVSGNIAYTDFSLDDVQAIVDTDPDDDVPGTFQNIAGTFLDVAQITPKLQYAFSADYRFDIPDGGAINLRGRVSWRDKISTNAAPAFEAAGIAVVTSNPVTDPLYISDSHTNVVAGISYRSVGDRWGLSLTGNNLLDERRPVATVFAVPGLLGALTQYNEPRTWTLAFTYDF